MIEKIYGWVGGWLGERGEKMRRAKKGDRTAGRTGGKKKSNK